MEIRDGLLAFGAEVTSQRALKVTGDVTVTQADTVDVDVQEPILTPTTTTDTVGTTSEQAVAANVNRKRLELFNCSSVTLHFRLANSGSATTSDPCLGAGERWCAPGVVVTGLQIIAASGSSNAYAVIEYA